MNIGRDIAEVKQQEDLLDPMNTPARPGMTKEEIFYLMASKLIRKGEKITPEMKQMMEHLAEMTAKELEKRPGDEDDHDPGREEKK